MKIINLTPHKVTIVNTEGTSIMEIPVSGIVARVTCETVQTGEIEGIPVTETSYSEVTGLPDPSEGIVYIVSSLVAQRCKDRNDVFIPNESVRDEEGRIIGCKSLGRV